VFRRMFTVVSSPSEENMKYILLLLLISAPCIAQSGPFGFEKGMTREQVIKLLGKSAVRDGELSSKDILTVLTAPKPHPGFAEYVLTISPRMGLVKVSAVGKTINTGDDGLDLRRTFDDVVEAISKKYGNPTGTTDHCNGGTGCDASEYWMMSLLDKNRSLRAFWTPPKERVAHVVAILVDAQAIELNKGFIGCFFEFEGFHDYADSRKDAQNDTF
jgi:hypothetical protein